MAISSTLDASMNRFFVGLLFSTTFVALIAMSAGAVASDELADDPEENSCESDCLTRLWSCETSCPPDTDACFETCFESYEACDDDC